MAKRYRYAFAQQKQAEGGIYSVVLAVISFVLFLADVAVSFFLQEYVISQALIGGISICAMLLAVYGFFMGMFSFSAENRIRFRGGCHENTDRGADGFSAGDR